MRVALGIAVAGVLAGGLVLVLTDGSGTVDTGRNRPLSVHEVRRSEQPPPHQLLAEFATNPRLHAAYVARRLRRDGVPPRGFRPARASCKPIGPPLFMCHAAPNLYLLAYYAPADDETSVRFLENGTGAPHFPCDGSVTGQLSLDRKQCVQLIRRDGYLSQVRTMAFVKPRP